APRQGDMTGDMRTVDAGNLGKLDIPDHTLDGKAPAPGRGIASETGLAQKAKQPFDATGRIIGLDIKIKQRLGGKAPVLMGEMQPALGGHGSAPTVDGVMRALDAGPRPRA